MIVDNSSTPSCARNTPLNRKNGNCDQHVDRPVERRPEALHRAQERRRDPRQPYRHYISGPVTRASSSLAPPRALASARRNDGEVAPSATATPGERAT